MKLYFLFNTTPISLSISAFHSPWTSDFYSGTQSLSVYPQMASGNSGSTLDVTNKSTSESLQDSEKRGLDRGEGSPALEEKEAIPPAEGDAAAQDVVCEQPQPKSKASGLSASLKRSRSYGDGHGYTCFGEDEETARDEADSEGEEFEVQWSGDSDPMNPRCMKNSKKWMIVIIVSLGSTCVYDVNPIGFQPEG